MKESTKCGIKNGETKLWKGKSIEPRNLKMDYSWKMSDAESISRSIMFNSVQMAHHANRNWNPAQTRKKKNYITKKPIEKLISFMQKHTILYCPSAQTNKTNKEAKEGKQRTGTWRCMQSCIDLARTSLSRWKFSRGKNTVNTYSMSAAPYSVTLKKTF